MDTFAKDVNLVSNLRGDSILPINALLNHPCLIPCHPTEAYLLSVCEKRSTLRTLYIPDACVVLPYFVEVTILRIANPNSVKQVEFRAFLTTLPGHTLFEVHRFDNQSFKVRFADKATALCIWCALKYCPFKDGLFSCVPMASVVRMEGRGPIRPQLKRLKREGRVLRNRKTRQQMQKAGDRMDDSRAAALARATVIAEWAEQPRAALLEPLRPGTLAAQTIRAASYQPL
jgi:hypothetical protein